MEDKQAALIPKFTTTENKFRTLTNVFKIDSIENVVQNTILWERRSSTSSRRWLTSCAFLIHIFLQIAAQKKRRRTNVKNYLIEFRSHGTKYVHQSALECKRDNQNIENKKNISMVGIPSGFVATVINVGSTSTQRRFLVVTKTDQKWP